QGAPPPDPRVASLIAQVGLGEAARPVRERSGWIRPSRVLVLNLPPELLPAVQAAAPGVQIVAAKDMAEAIALAGDVDAVLGACSAELLAAGRRIRWIQAYTAGVERCVAVPALRERDVLLTNMQRVAGA